MTPNFPSWAGRFATQLHQLRSTTGAALHQFEALFALWLPPHRLAQQDEKAHSRNRCWNLRLVFWTFLWQVAQAGSSCREAIRQAQSLCHLLHRAIPPDETSPYCQARGNLPIQRLEEIHQAIVSEAEAAMAQKDLWCGHRVRVVDASTLTLPDTPENQKLYPQQSVQKPGCGFPIMRLIGLFNLATGMLTGWVTGHWRQNELVLLQELWEQLRPGEVLLGDRTFSAWAVIAQGVVRGVHGVFRVGSRRSDFRSGRRLSRHERLVQWPKPWSLPTYLSPHQWAQLPDKLQLRLVRTRLEVPGFRTQEVILVTSLLDSVKYPPEALAQLYRRRWEMELSFRHLKTTLQMEHLSCKNPDNVQRELRMHLLVHNLIRRLMLESARRANVPLSRISFAGALAVARRYGEALLQARTTRQRNQLVLEVYRILAADLVPNRLGRREPRALKRRPKPYPLLSCHRSRYREIPHKNHCRKAAPTTKNPRNS